MGMNVVAKIRQATRRKYTGEVERGNAIPAQGNQPSTAGAGRGETVP